MEIKRIENFGSKGDNYTRVVENKVNELIGVINTMQKTIDKLEKERHDKEIESHHKFWD